MGKKNDYGINSRANNMESKKEACERVAKLVRELKGNRSIRKTAEDSGVAASYINGILNERYLPSADILRKLTEPNAKPQNGITLQDLMIAAGYQEDYVLIMSEAGPIEVERKDLDPSIHYAFVNSDDYMDYRERERKLRHEQRLQISKFETMATGIIYKCLAEKQIPFSNVEKTLGIRGYKPDIVLNVPKHPVSEWWFEVKYINRNNRVGGVHLPYLLSQFLFIEPKKERKITLVINDGFLFEGLRGYKNKLAYKGDLSVVLIDEENFAIVEEIYLAHYDEENMLSEFYLK